MKKNLLVFVLISVLTSCSLIFSPENGLEKVTYTYYANDGSGREEVIEFEKDLKGTVTRTFSRDDGYAFLGWAYSANGGIFYRYGSECNYSEDTELYAIWGENSVEYTYDGGSYSVTGSVDGVTDAVVFAEHNQESDDPEDVVCVRQNVFYDNTTIESIEFEGSLEFIDGYSFSHCPNLVSVVFNGSVESMGAGVFSDCTSLQQISLPSGVQTQQGFCFSRCTSLREVTINSDADIPIGFFNECISLEKIIINSDSLLNITGSNVFLNVPSTMTVYVRDSVKAQYQADDTWNNFNIQSIQ